MKRLTRKYLFNAIFLATICINVSASDAHKSTKTVVEDFLATNPPINQIHIGLIQQKFTCKELINGYLLRIKQYNLTTTDNLAPLNAITQLNPQAEVEAKKLDEKLKQFNIDKLKISNLFCIPVIIKDNINVQGMRTSSGSLSLLGTYPINDAEIVQKIKHNGGIIIAKSSMDELAGGLSGMSSLSGRIGNAFNSSYNSGGSSGGSAVSVAAGFAPLAIGSDNSGSVRIPASYNGIYGLRPTYGLISHEGIFPLGNLDGTAGPMANNVVDLAKLLTTIVDKHKIDYSQSLDENSLSGKHFAIIRSVAGKPLWDNMPKEIINIYKNIKSNLQMQSVIITEIDLPRYNLSRQYNMAGTSDEVRAYLAKNISNINQFREICLANTRVFGNQQECLKFIDAIKSKHSLEYQQVSKTILKNQDYVISIMKQQSLDGLILPSGKSGIASYDGNQIGDQSIIASNSGLPEITIPVGQYMGLPVGLEILGSKFTESKLLNYAFAYQQHIYSFKAPNLHKDTLFDDWRIDELNTLYSLIGKVNSEDVIKSNHNNKITPQQSNKLIKKATSMLNHKQD